MAPRECDLLERHALGVVRLSLGNNVAYNIVNVKTTHGLVKVICNMYKTPSITNKILLMIVSESEDGGYLND